MGSPEDEGGVIQVRVIPPTEEINWHFLLNDDFKNLYSVQILKEQM